MSANPDVVLAGALPQLRVAEKQLRALAAKEGITYGIADFGAIRTQADTTTILGYRAAEYKQYVKTLKPGQTPKPINEWRRIAPYGHSYHNYGAAFDVAITGHPPTMTAYQALTHLGALAPMAGLRWGAAFGDTPHFELAISLDAAKALWDKFKGNAANQMDAILAAGIPGLAVTGGAGVSSITLAAARTPAARAAITTGAVLVVGLLTWVAVRRLIDD